MKVLVAGGRNYSNLQYVFDILDAIGPSTVIHGAAQGADRLAGRWAQERGVTCRPYPADWNRYRKSAGFRRNEAMLDKEHPDLVVAFPGGNGTAHMIRTARQRGYPVFQP